MPQVAADERQRVDELDEPVREHDQQRGRMLQPVAQLLEQARFVEIDAHPAAVLCFLGAKRIEECSVLLLRHFQVTPGFHRIARIHRASGIEAVGAEVISEVHGRADLLNVEPRRRKIDFNRHGRGVQVAHAVDRAREVAEHADAVERRP